MVDPHSESPTRNLGLFRRSGLREHPDGIVQEVRRAGFPMAGDHHVYLGIPSFYLVHRPGPCLDVGVAEVAFAGTEFFYEAASKQDLFRFKPGHDVVAGMAFAVKAHPNRIGSEAEVQGVLKGGFGDSALVGPGQFPGQGRGIGGNALCMEGLESTQAIVVEMGWHNGPDPEVEGVGHPLDEALGIGIGGRGIENHSFSAAVQDQSVAGDFTELIGLKVGDVHKGMGRNLEDAQFGPGKNQGECRRGGPRSCTG